MRKTFRLLGVAFFVFQVGCQLSTGDRAKDFALPSLYAEASPIRLSVLNQEHPVLLVFWATWCPTCLSEIPKLNEWHDRYQSQALEIVGISVQEAREDVAQFVAETPVSYRVLLDEEGAVAEDYGVSALPTIVFLAKGGEIRYYGFSLPSNLEELLGKSQ